jgi:hypothetical protein
MSSIAIGQVSRVTINPRTPGSLVLEPEGGTGLRVFISGYRGDRLPSRLHDARIAPPGDAGWRLSCREGDYGFEARGLEVHEPHPGLFDDLVAGHALGSRDRLMVRCLLRLLRLPGGERLLRTWHARRR